MAGLKNTKTPSIKKIEVPSEQKTEGSASRNQGAKINTKKTNDKSLSKGKPLKNNKGTGNGFDGPNYFGSEQPSTKDNNSPAESKKDSKQAGKKSKK